MKMSDDDSVRVTVCVPEEVRDAAKDKLPHGGMSEEVRDLLTRIAFGEEVNQRSRLERQAEELRERRAEKRRERRELDANIENLDDRIETIERKLGELSTREERYEAKLEELEYRLRSEGTRIFTGHGLVERVASEAGVEPEGVIGDLKERNPDVPDFAFEPAIHDHENEWNGLPDDEAETPVDEREEGFR